MACLDRGRFVAVLLAGLVFASIVITVAIVNHYLVLALTNVSNDYEASAKTHAYTDQLFESLLDLETGERGFIITGRDVYLAPYVNGSHTVWSWYNLVTKQYSDADGALHDLIQGKLLFVNQAIALRQKEGFEAAKALVDTDKGKNQMDALRKVLARIKQQMETRTKQVGDHRAVVVIYIQVALFSFAVLALAAGTKYTYERVSARMTMLDEIPPPNRPSPYVPSRQLMDALRGRCSPYLATRPLTDPAALGEHRSPFMSARKSPESPV